MAPSTSPTRRYTATTSMGAMRPIWSGSEGGYSASTPCMPASDAARITKSRRSMCNWASVSSTDGDDV